MLNTNKKIFIIFTIFIFSILLINYLLDLKQKKLALISIHPQNTINVELNQEFKFIFNTSPKNIDIKTIPSFPFIKETTQNNLIIKPQNNLNLAKNYKIILTKNEEYTYIHDFTTRGISETEIITQDEKQTLDLYPLITYTPIKNKKFYLTYSSPLTLKVEIKQGYTTKEVEKEIINWIKSKNIDPATHKIIYKP